MYEVRGAYRSLVAFWLWVSIERYLENEAGGLAKQVILSKRLSGPGKF